MGPLSSPVVRDFLYDAPHSNGQTDEWTDGIGLAKVALCTKVHRPPKTNLATMKFQVYFRHIRVQMTN